MPRARSFVISVLISQSLIFLGPRAQGLGPDLAAAQSSAVAGQVVDPQGGAVVRAIIRAIDASGKEVGVTLTDANGRFTFASLSCSNCKVEASRAGFTPATAPVGGGEIKIALGLAPLRDEVVVSPTLEPTPASQTGASVTVITAADIERRGTPLVADLLRTTPSATVVRTGMPGGVTSLFIRAGESDYVKVLLDGIPLNEPGGTFYFDRLSSDHLEQIEVVRGAHSALFGSDAMSGVIQLVSKRGAGNTARPAATFDLSGGTYSTVDTGGSISGRRRGWDYFGALAYFSTDNRVENSDFDNTTFSANAGGALGAHMQLRVIGRVETGEAGAPGTTAFGPPDLDARSNRRDTAFGVRFDHTLARFSQRVMFSTATSDQRFANQIADPPYLPELDGQVGDFLNFDFPFANHNSLQRPRLSYQGDWHLGAIGGIRGVHLLTVIADVDFERADLENLDPATLARTQLIEASRNNGGVAVQYEWSVGRAAITGGLRFDHNANFGNEASPRVLATAIVADRNGTIGDTRIRFSAGKGVKEPTMLESFSPSPFFEGNPDLLPERSRSIDIGVEQHLANDRVRVDAVYFDTRNRNQISTVTTDPVNFFARYYNVGNTRARGLELTVDTAPTSRLRLRGGYSFVASEILESDPIPGGTPPQFTPGRWAFRRPRHLGNVEGMWTNGRLSASLLGTFVGRRTDSDFGTFTPPILELPAYAIWRAGVRYALPRYVDLTLDIDNLTNTDYMEPLGYLTLERTVRVGARVRF